MKQQQLIKHAADEIINTRDFLGNEQAALAEFEAEHGSFSNEERAQIWRLTGKIWKKSQKKANAKPLSNHQRQRSYRALAG